MKPEKALIYNMIGLIEYFIKNKVRFINEVDNSGNTYLHKAVRSNKPQIVRLMIEHGFDINARNNHGFTPLHYAVRIGTEIILKMLLENGADSQSASSRVDSFNGSYNG